MSEQLQEAIEKALHKEKLSHGTITLYYARNYNKSMRILCYSGIQENPAADDIVVLANRDVILARIMHVPEEFLELVAITYKAGWHYVQTAAVATIDTTRNVLT